MNLLQNITIRVNESVFIKDPETSDLGKKIVQGSIELIDELGFEAFTFGKLARHISSTEASVYRYFESKHKLLLYLISWYWGWMQYRLVFSISNIESPVERLNRAIALFTEKVEMHRSKSHIDEAKLNRIVIAESAKAYLTKEVDAENKEGVFSTYKQLVGRVSDIIGEIDPNYKYPHMLITSVIEGAHLQRFFAEHLPRLTDTVEDEDAIVSFYREMVLKVIGAEDCKR